MINEVGTVAKSNRKIVTIETKTDTRSLFWLGRGFSIKSGGVKLFKRNYAVIQTRICLGRNYDS